MISESFIIDILSARPNDSQFPFLNHSTYFALGMLDMDGPPSLCP